MSVKLHIKKGDMVYVNAGDSKGQQGKVLKVDAQKCIRFQLPYCPDANAMISNESI